MIVPIKDILGRSVYTKVIALSDSLDIGKDFDLKDLAIMSAMCGGAENGAQMGQILPLMLFKDNVGRSSDDMMKMMCMSSMMTSPSNGNVQMNQMLPLMLLRKDSDDSGDMMKMMAVSSMMGGNQEGAGNPFMGYMMLDMLKDKKNTTPNNN